MITLRISKTFRKFYRKTFVFGPLFKKIAGLKAHNFIKKRLQHNCFPGKPAKFLRTPFFTEHLHWLLLVTKIKLRPKHDLWILRKNHTTTPKNVLENLYECYMTISIYQ